MNRVMLVSSCAVAVALVALAFIVPSREVRAAETDAAKRPGFEVKPEGGVEFPKCIQEQKVETTSTSGTAETKTDATKKTKPGTTKTATASETVSSVRYKCVPGCTYNVYAADPKGSAKLQIANDECKTLTVPRGGDRDRIEANCRATKRCVVQSCTITKKCGATRLGRVCSDVESCTVVSGDELEKLLGGVSGPSTPSTSGALTPKEEALKKIKLLETKRDALAKAFEAVKKIEAGACKGAPDGACVLSEKSVIAAGLKDFASCSGGTCEIDVGGTKKTIEAEVVKLNADIAKKKGGLEVPTPGADPRKKPPTRRPSDLTPDPTYTGPPSTFSGPSGSRGGGLGNLGSILGTAGKVLAGIFGGQQCPQQQQQAQTCPTDPQAYQRYQQWYQQQLQQYQYRMQMYQQQRQMNAYYGRTTTACPPQPPVPCKPGGSSNGSGGTGDTPCKASPRVPNSACAAGWRPVYTGTCITDWTCGGGSTPSGPSAQISCQPKIADVETTIAISFSCSSGTAEGTGFETQDEQSGSATAVIEEPAKGVKTAEFGLTCTDDGRSSSRTCGVRINKPVIVFVSNPKKIAPDETATIGWVTSGMESCIVSSPDFSVFTEENKDKPKKKGAVETPELTKTSTFKLECVTLGGGTKVAEEEVVVESNVVALKAEEL